MIADQATISKEADRSYNPSFLSGAVWPIDRAALAALVDLGLSDQQMAAYFSVNARKVKALRRRYELLS